MTMEFYSIGQIAEQDQGSAAKRVLWGNESVEQVKPPVKNPEISPEILPKTEITEEKKVSPGDDCVADTGGSALEQTNAYFNRQFRILDANHNGQISKEEVQERLKTATCANEMRVLSWLDKHMKTVGKLGDEKSGFSMEDLRAFDDAAKNGTGNLKWALKDINFSGKAFGAVAGPYIANKILSAGMSGREMLMMGAFYFGATTAIDIGWYYAFDRGKIDNAVQDLEAPK